MKRVQHAGFAMKHGWRSVFQGVHFGFEHTISTEAGPCLSHEITHFIGTIGSVIHIDPTYAQVQPTPRVTHLRTNCPLSTLPQAIVSSINKSKSGGLIPMCLVDQAAPIPPVQYSILRFNFIRGSKTAPSMLAGVSSSSWPQGPFYFSCFILPPKHMAPDCTLATVL